VELLDQIMVIFHIVFRYHNFSKQKLMKWSHHSSSFNNLNHRGRKESAPFHCMMEKEQHLMGIPMSRIQDSIKFQKNKIKQKKPMSQATTLFRKMVHIIKHKQKMWVVLRI